MGRQAAWDTNLLGTQAAGPSLILDLRLGDLQYMTVGKVGISSVLGPQSNKCPTAQAET